jgi:hypothetical protein
MSTWPSFTNEALADGRTWSATFDSYDQYLDFVYYVVTEGGGDRFMVQLALDWSVGIEDWDSAEFIAGLRRAVAEVATTGETNTTHTRW